MHVRLHEFLQSTSFSLLSQHRSVLILAATNLNEIDLIERLVVSWFLDVQDADDVLVIEMSKQFHLS